MTEPVDPSAPRRSLARVELAPLGFLVGDWVGEGRDFGGRVLAEATGRIFLDGTWLQVREVLRDETGEVVYEDVTLYRFDPSEGNHRVLHLLPGGRRQEYPVVLENGGFRWVTGPYGPRVEIHPTDGGWGSCVLLPDEPDPSLVLAYRRR